MDNIYTEAKRLGIPMDSHESDLYLKVTPESSELVKKYDRNKIAKQFTNQIDHTLWYDLPFMFAPFWENKQR
jgi:hypothetical protein